MNSFEEVQVGGMTVANPRLLAEGGFGLVYAVTDRSGVEYVMKKCSIQRQEEFNTVQKEVQILDKLRECPYVVNMVSSHVSPSKEGLILLEMCRGGHLLDRLNRKRSSGGYLDSRSIFQIFGQILSAVKVMHEMRPYVTNRDLKLENVLFGGPDNNTVKLCDFGSCVFGPVFIRNQTEKTEAEEVINKETTPAYRAPEMVDLYMRSELTFKTDIWALGCILYTLCYCIHPFQDGGNLATLNGITSFPSSPAIPRDLQTLIIRMCDFDPEARPTTAQLIDATTALMQGSPLPAFSLSEEVIQLRRERQEQMARRAEKDAEVAKKAAARGKNAILARKREGQGKVVGGSVAAQRLARMRGGASPSSSSGQSSMFDDDVSGDPAEGKVAFVDVFGDSFASSSSGIFGAADVLGGGDQGNLESDPGGEFQGFLGSPKVTQPGQDAMAAYFDNGSARNVFGSPSGSGTTSFADFDAPVPASSDPFASNGAAAGIMSLSGGSGDILDKSGFADDGFGFGVLGATSPASAAVFADNGSADASGGGGAKATLAPLDIPANSGGFSEFSGDSPVSQTPSRPLSEAFGSSSGAGDDAFQRPPSGAFAGAGGGAAPLGFDSFTPATSRPTSGTFDEFSSLPAAGRSFDDQDPHNTSTLSSGSAAAAFNSLPSAPSTPHSSIKFHGSPIPVAKLVDHSGSKAGSTPMASVVGKTEEVSVGGSEYIVDALHNMSFKNMPTNNARDNSSKESAGGTLFDFSDDPGPTTNAWDVGATMSLSVPSGPPPDDPFGNEPTLLIPESKSSHGTAVTHSKPVDMDADLFGAGAGGRGEAKADILSLFNAQEPGPGAISPSAPPAPVSAPTMRSGLGAPMSSAQGSASFEQPKPVMLRPPPVATSPGGGGIPSSPGQGGAMMYPPSGRSPMPLHTTASFGVMNAPAMGGRVALHTGRGSLVAGAGGNGSMGGSWTDSVPQVMPVGMKGEFGMIAGAGAGPGMLGPGMRAPPTPAMPPMGIAPQGMQQQFSAPPPGQEFTNATLGVSLQPAGLHMNLNQSFDQSPLTSPSHSNPNSRPSSMGFSNSRPGSMGLPAPPSAHLAVTRGHVPTPAAAPADPFGGLASFGGQK